MPATQHTEVFNCSREEFYKIVTDYEKYPEFLQEVKECKILKTDDGPSGPGTRQLVEYKVSVIKSFKYELWMTHTPDEAVSWTFAGGDIFKTNSGSWKIEDQAGKAKVTYAVEATFGVFVPGMIAKTLLNVNLPAMMSAYHKRIKDLYGK
ncbi:MAG: SRPBCC family protein [Proteobacteria bacterium]|nr:MAG: SRPBCC family protein [Pseudomonadota bacterium]